MTDPGVAAARGQLTPAPIEILPVHGQVSLLASAGANTLIQVGPQGVLVVDTMREQDADQLLLAIRKVARNKPIRYVVNTHAHPGHTGGNLKIAKAGSQPGENPFLVEFREQTHLPEVATRGGAATMYPEFQATLKAATAKAPPK